MSANNPFPLCQLHGTRIVDGFPGRCPLLGDTTLEQLTNEAWAMLGRQQREGLDELKRAQICEGCQRRLATHTRIRYLRKLFTENGDA